VTGQRYYESKAELKQALVEQLYDRWHGWYMSQRLFMGQWQDVRVLSRTEALTYKCAKDEALNLRW
jgi:hypothetical protein